MTIKIPELMNASGENCPSRGLGGQDFPSRAPRDDQWDLPSIAPGDDQGDLPSRAPEDDQENLSFKDV